MGLGVGVPGAWQGESVGGRVSKQVRQCVRELVRQCVSRFSCLAAWRPALGRLRNLATPTAAILRLYFLWRLVLTLEMDACGA